MMLYSHQFAEIDVALRRGRHLSRHDYLTYEFIAQNFDDLERFYAGYACRLVQHPDGFFFLLGQGLLPSRKLSRGVMHLGKFIALKARDPELTKANGRISVQELLHDVETSTPPETLTKVYAPKRKEVLTGAAVYEEVLKCLQMLDELGFVSRAGDYVVPREAIHRFAELARHDNSPSDLSKIALEAQRGVVFDEVDDDSTGEADEGQDK